MGADTGTTTLEKINQGGHSFKLTFLFQEAAPLFPFPSSSEFPGISSHENEKKKSQTRISVFHYNVIHKKYSAKTKSSYSIWYIPWSVHIKVRKMF